MDREPEELQFLGFFGIFKESYKIIFSWRKLFSRITIALILPLSLIFLANIQISDLILSKINNSEEALDYSQDGSPKQDAILNRILAEWATYLLLKMAYLIFVLVFSLLSTSGVVYTIACIYTAKDITFKRIMHVVPKVWKRLMITFLWAIILTLGYNTITALIMALCLAITGPGKARIVAFLIMIVAYLMGLMYISVVWHLASVVSVLENIYGLTAMQKSKALIKGKTWVACAIFLTLNLSFMAVHVLFARFVVHGETPGVGARLGYGLLILLCLAILILFGLVVQTVIYFMCKSYHHEHIDKSCLADHLGVYLGEYVPLKGSAVQLEQLDV